MNTPTAAQIHHYDQAHARRTIELDALIIANREMRSTHHRESIVAATAHHLRDSNTEALAELLACAVERLAEQPEKAPPVV
jgi:hypothetical protein